MTSNVYCSLFSTCISCKNDILDSYFNAQKRDFYLTLLRLKWQRYLTVSYRWKLAPNLSNEKQHNGLQIIGNCLLVMTVSINYIHSLILQIWFLFWGRGKDQKWSQRWGQKIHKIQTSKNLIIVKDNLWTCSHREIFISEIKQDFV